MYPPTGFEGVVREAPTGERPETVHIRLLGGFSVTVGTRTIQQNEWGLRKAATLVKLLALAPSHRLHREQAMDILWPDSGRKAASNNLRGILHAARRTLDPAAGSRYLASEDESLMLYPKSDLWVDVEAFEQAAATARRSRDPAAYRAAIELYAGDLLPEDRYEEWAEVHRRRLRETYLSLLLALAHLHEERAEYDSAAEALRRVVAEESTREEAHVGLMRVYALAGSKGEALAQYSRLEEILLKELGTEPAASSCALSEEIAAGRFPPPDRRVGPPERESSDRLRHNLPAPRTSFVGRERELLEVKRALAMTRLLTLTGTGGSGKTRLALEVARDLVGAYPDGVWLVKLAPLSEPELMPQAVASALGVREAPGRTLGEALVEHLRTESLLLVLDNCEHLIDACVALVDTLLLPACPSLKILATSREALGVEGEISWPVPPLSLPDPHHLPPLEELIRYEAVRLFTERARAVGASFELGPQNAPAVARVCNRLDGMPLAIELAAARTRVLSAEQIAARLEESFRLLKSESRTIDPRHRTLRATIDWSFELLSEREGILFRRLSVFAGGWTLEAAEAVCAGEGVEDEEVLDLLSGLVHKSLVVAEATGDGGMRYRMLEPVRQYARKRLEDSDEAETVLRRHAAFFLALAEQEPEAFKGLRQPGWIRRLETEHDNLRAALSWSLESEEVELGLRLAAALYPFWDRGHYVEGRQWLDAALAKGGRTPTPVRVNALRGVGWLAQWQGDINRALTAAEEGLRLSSSQPGKGNSVAIHLQLLLGYTAEHRADYERATGLFEESLRLSREAEDEWGMAASLLHLGNVAGEQDDHERAMEFYEEGLALCRKSGHAVVLADTLTSLGYELLLQGDYERAAGLNAEAVALYREQGYGGARLVYSLDNMGWAALLGGDHERARTLHEESLGLCRALDDKLTAAECLEGLACAAGASGEAERSVRLFGAADALRTHLREEQGITQVPAERALREPYMGAARSQLGVKAWKEMWAEGKNMGLEEAVEYALTEEAATTASPAPEEPPTGAPPAALTRREEEVAVLVSRGLTNRQIASELSISEHTVATHIAKILKRLGLSSRSRLSAWVTERGLTSQDSDWQKSASRVPGGGH